MIPRIEKVEACCRSIFVKFLLLGKEHRLVSKRVVDFFVFFFYFYYFFLNRSIQGIFTRMS